MCHIAIVDDHALLLNGLQSVLKASGRFEHIATFTSGADFLEEYRGGARFDILLTDLQMPGMSGTEVIEAVYRLDPELPVLIMTMMSNAARLKSMGKHNIRGWFVKGGSAPELISAINKILEGDTCFDCDKEEDRVNGHATREALSTRELQVAQQIALGRTSLEIAETLFVSHHTVKTHRKNIFRKLGVHNTVELMQYLSQNELI